MIYWPAVQMLTWGLRARAMPRLSGYRSTPPDLAERKLEQLDGGFRQSIRARDRHTNGERVNRRDFGSYFSSAKGI
jgi:hypothetical protein